MLAAQMAMPAPDVNKPKNAEPADVRQDLAQPADARAPSAVSHLQHAADAGRVLMIPGTNEPHAPEPALRLVGKGGPIYVPTAAATDVTPPGLFQRFALFLANGLIRLVRTKPGG